MGAGGGGAAVGEGEEGEGQAGSDVSCVLLSNSRYRCNLARAAVVCRGVASFSPDALHGRLYLARSTAVVSSFAKFVTNASQCPREAERIEATKGKSSCLAPTY